MAFVWILWYAFMLEHHFASFICVYLFLKKILTPSYFFCPIRKVNFFKGISFIVLSTF